MCDDHSVLAHESSRSSVAVISLSTSLVGSSRRGTFGSVARRHSTAADMTTRGRRLARTAGRRNPRRSQLGRGGLAAFDLIAAAPASTSAIGRRQAVPDRPRADRARSPDDLAARHVRHQAGRCPAIKPSRVDCRRRCPDADRSQARSAVPISRNTGRPQKAGEPNPRRAGRRRPFRARAAASGQRQRCCAVAARLRSVAASIRNLGLQVRAGAAAQPSSSAQRVPPLGFGRGSRSRSTRYVRVAPSGSFRALPMLWATSSKGTSDRG